MRLSEKEAIILTLIRDGKHYGLDMLRGSKGALTRGGIYTQLDRMQRKGLVGSRSEESAVGPARRVYSLTGLGRTALLAHEAAEAVFSDALLGGAS